MTGNNPLKVLFLCTGNSCRSQMAEGFARELGKGLLAPFSAGLAPCYVHPRAVTVMREIGIDISQQQSKALDENMLKEMDVVITLCGHAQSSCPAVPAPVRRRHWPIRDPVGTVGSDREIMAAFRNAREEIRKRIEAFLEELRSTD